MEKHGDLNWAAEYSYECPEYGIRDPIQTNPYGEATALPAIFHGVAYSGAYPLSVSQNQQMNFVASSAAAETSSEFQTPYMMAGTSSSGVYKRLVDMNHNNRWGEVFGAGIGLNLGVRTYFCGEDILAVSLGRRPRVGFSSPAPSCQAEGCKADLNMAKHYHRRHKVCELHSKASKVVTNGLTQRFCQQCSRFHALTEFDEGKRSCRKRLADHNRRRRKPPSTGLEAGTDADHPGKKHMDCLEETTSMNLE